MSVLTIRCGENIFNVSGKDILQLELKLNLTEKSREYSKIGDYIYNFYVKEGCEGQPCDILDVEQIQYDYLLQIHNTSYEDVLSKKHPYTPSTHT